MTRFLNALKPSLYSFLSILCCFAVISLAKEMLPRDVVAGGLFFLASTVLCMIVAGYVSVATKL